MADTKNNEKSTLDGAKLASGLSAMSGLTSLLTPTGNADIADTSQQWDAISNMKGGMRGDYNSFDQIASEYSSISNLQPDLDYDTIRGGSTGQRVGSTVSSTLSGAAAGAKVGGVYGAIAGAVIGLGKGVGEWITGNQKAKNEQSILQSEQQAAQEIAGMRRNTAADNLSTSNFNNAYANRAALGGQLERKTMNIRDFADAVKARRTESDRTHSAGIVRVHCNGGTMIRIKR